DRGSEVVLQIHQDGENAHDGERRQQTSEKGGEGFAVSGEFHSEEQEQGELGGLRGLETETGDLYPPLRAEAFVADLGNQNGDQQENPEERDAAVDPRIGPAAVVEVTRDRECDEADTDVD